MIRLVFAVLCLFAAAPAHASDDDYDDDRKDRAGLNAAIERGEILSLSEILKRVTPKLEGRIVEIEFEYEDGRPIYEIYILRKDGRRLEYEIDARTAQILDLKDED